MASQSIGIPTLPDESGHYGPYGGRFVPETLMALLEDLEAAYKAAKADPAYQEELDAPRKVEEVPLVPVRGVDFVRNQKSSVD